MIKAIALLKKKAGLSREAFIAYYEGQHAPLMRGMLPGIVDYRRNYVDLDQAFVPLGRPLDFDVITELRFASRADYDRFLATAAEPDVARTIAEDEENLFDRSATRMFMVEENGAAG